MSRQPAVGTGAGPRRPGSGAVALGQEAAGDSLGAIDGLLMSGADGLDMSGADGAVVDSAGVELAPGLVHATIEPARASANRILLNMKRLSSDCLGRWITSPAGGAGL